MKNLLKMYQKVLNERPILSQAVQTGILMGAGDLICQKLVEEKQIVDWKRTAKFTSVGLFLAGPALRQWYGVLNSKITVGSPAVIAAKKVLCDQLLFAPGFIALLLTTFNGLQGLTVEQNMKKLKQDYPDVLKNNYLLWPWIQMGNFFMVPLNYQVLVVQFVCLFWNTYISWKAHTNVPLKKISMNH